MRKTEAIFKKHNLAQRKSAWGDICENHFNQSTPTKTLWKNLQDISIESSLFKGLSLMMFT